MSGISSAGARHCAYVALDNKDASVELYVLYTGVCLTKEHLM